MKALLAALKRAYLRQRLADMRIAHDLDRALFDEVCLRLSAHRQTIAAAELELDVLQGRRHQQSAHQLRPR